MATYNEHAGLHTPGRAAKWGCGLILVLLLVGGCGSPPTVTPPNFQGRLLAFHKTSESESLVEFRAGASGPQEVVRLEKVCSAPRPGKTEGPILSADGRYLFCRMGFYVDTQTGVHTLLPVGEEGQEVTQEFLSLEVSPDGHHVAYTSGEEATRGTLHIVDVQSGERTIILPQGKYGYYDELAFSPNSQRMAYVVGYSDAAGSHKKVRVFDLETHTTADVRELACAHYTSGWHCAESVVRWIDTDHLMIARRKGMPSSIDSAFISPNTISAFALDGSEVGVCSFDNGISVKALAGSTLYFNPSGLFYWLDLDTLAQGLCDPHKTTVSGTLGLLLPDGRNIYGYNSRRKWSLYDIRQEKWQNHGQELDIADQLATVRECVWAPDLIAGACAGYEKRGESYVLLIVPLAQEPGQAILRWKPQAENYQLLGWVQ